ncbi:hypothetical protein HDU96_002860, partial [Phlyctochytrium bullatum]
MTTPKDPYKVLGVSKDATLDQIKKAYKVQALKHHPDRHPEDKREEQKAIFQDISAAFDTLSDPTKRRDYDSRASYAAFPSYFNAPFTSQAYGYAPRTSNFPYGSTSSQSYWSRPTSTFTSFGGTWSGYQGTTSRPPEPEPSTIRVTLEMLFSSKPKVLKITRKRFEVTGQGWDETLKVSIPLAPTNYHGDVITVPTYGNQIFGTTKFQDLKVKLDVSPHPVYARGTKFEDPDGQLRAEVVLSCEEALTGVMGKPMTGLDGSPFYLIVPRRYTPIKDGYKHAFAGYGMPRPNGFRGVLVVTFRVPQANPDSRPSPARAKPSTSSSQPSDSRKPSTSSHAYPSRAGKRPSFSQKVPYSKPAPWGPGSAPSSLGDEDANINTFVNIPDDDEDMFARHEDIFLGRSDRTR